MEHRLHKIHRAHLDRYAYYHAFAKVVAATIREGGADAAHAIAACKIS